MPLTPKFYIQKSSKSGKLYYLHQRHQELKGGRSTILYYFGLQPKEGAIAHLPEGYEVSENQKTGLPLLRKKK